MRASAHGDADVEIENYNVDQITTGLRGELTGLRDWVYDAYISYGRVDNGTVYTGYLSRSALQRLCREAAGTITPSKH